MSALLQAALWSGLVSLMVLAAARVWRRYDAALWHRVWGAVAAGSIGLPAAIAAVPDAVVLSLPIATATSPEAAVASTSGSLTWLAVVYLAGAAFFGLRLAGGLLLVSRLRRASVPVEGPPRRWLDTAVGDAAALVRTHRRVQVPITAGLRRPLVILPDTWMLWEPARLSAVLRHELAHVARHDYRWNLLGALFHAIFWFSPAAWLVVRRLRLTAELAADRSASEIIGPLLYARVLIESARELMQGRTASVLAPGAATALDARVAALTTSAGDERPAPPRARRIAMAAVMAVLLATAAIGLSTAPAAPHADHDARHQLRHSH